MEKNVLEFKIQELIALTKNDEQISEISEDLVKQASKIANDRVDSLDECFLALSALNLLNTAIKRDEFKDSLYYGMIKACVSRLFSRLISLDMSSVDLSINIKEQCAYIKIYGLQFSFHHIGIGDDIKGFINKDKNTIVEWEGVRLQKIAGELFTLALEL
ncbi:MAG: hypothetical protein WBG43_04900 [Marinifilaceae bacterium]